MMAEWCSCRFVVGADKEGDKERNEWPHEGEVPVDKESEHTLTMRR